MMGLLECTQGRVVCEARNVVGNSAYRNAIAAITQDDQLLSGSIADNITCFDEQPDLQLMVRCAQLACVHEDVHQMPMQYHTLVGDMGSTLSGGQRQRILLARALYRRPRVLFMDEATSHLDLETERQVLDNLAKQPMTKIFVAHRPQALALADEIIRIDQ